jgi:hypothetical protein
MNGLQTERAKWNAGKTTRWDSEKKETETNNEREREVKGGNTKTRSEEIKEAKRDKSPIQRTNPSDPQSALRFIALYEDCWRHNKSEQHPGKSVAAGEAQHSLRLVAIA